MNENEYKSCLTCIHYIRAIYEHDMYNCRMIDEEVSDVGAETYSAHVIENPEKFYCSLHDGDFSKKKCSNCKAFSSEHILDCRMFYYTTDSGSIKEIKKNEEFNIDIIKPEYFHCKYFEFKL